MPTSNIVNQLMAGEKILIEEHQPWFTLIPSGIFIIPILRWLKTSVAVTNRRIIAISGIFSPDTFEARLNKVASLTFHQSLMGRIFSYGTVVIKNFGGESFTYKNIMNAKKLRQVFNEALEEMENPNQIQKQ